MNPSEEKITATKKIMTETLALVKKLGVGAVELLKKIKKDKSPQAMIKTIEESLAANHARIGSFGKTIRGHCLEKESLPIRPKGPAENTGGRTCQFAFVLQGHGTGTEGTARK